MFELELQLENDLPFAVLSRTFPDLRIFRWCSSHVDYLEIYGQADLLLQLKGQIDEFAHGLGSSVVKSSIYNERLTVMLACRCSIGNSAIRMVEARNFLWEAPASYHKGIETIKMVSLGEENMQELYSDLSRIGEVKVEKKRKLLPDTMRDVYTISLSVLTGELTPKQIRYLKDAISMGFFATPRRVRIEELASIHGVSKSTMQEHINKARYKLMLALEPYLNLAEQ